MPTSAAALASTASEQLAITTQSQYKSIAIITCSTRPTRIGPSITSYVESLVCSNLTPNVKASISIIDLSAPPAAGLPFFDEPKLPAHLNRENPTAEYAHQHSRNWSAEIAKHQAFIFITPQYNWSIPAVLKNALDFLFWEWAGKPASVISYGVRGGNKGRAACEQVLTGLHMPLSPGVEIKINEEQGEALKEGEKDALVLKWKEEGVEEAVKLAWDCLLETMIKPISDKGRH